MTDHKRGELEAYDFAAAIIETLNNEQNRDKTHWRAVSLRALNAGLGHEMRELDDEVYDFSVAVDNEPLPLHRESLQKIMAEAADVAAYSMFIWDKARRELEDE